MRRIRATSKVASTGHHQDDFHGPGASTRRFLHQCLVVMKGWGSLHSTRAGDARPETEQTRDFETHLLLNFINHPSWLFHKISESDCMRQVPVRFGSQFSELQDTSQLRSGSSMCMAINSKAMLWRQYDAALLSGPTGRWTGNFAIPNI